MKSLLHLVLICALITGSTAVAFDVFAASGEGIVLPLNVRLQHTSGSVCNGFVWTFEGPGRFLRQLASVNDECNKQECNNKTRPHCSLSSNGSLQLYGVRPEDAGLYTISTYHITRAKSTEDTFNLRVLDAVSQPVVSLECPSDGQPEVSCRAANGTNISTSITVNGKRLRKKAKSDGKVNLFKVSSSAPWNIICSVTNEISHKTISVLYTMCPERQRPPASDVIKKHPHGKEEQGVQEVMMWPPQNPDPIIRSLWDYMKIQSDMRRLTEDLCSVLQDVWKNLPAELLHKLCRRS